MTQDKLKQRPIEKIIKDFQELKLSDILGGLDSGDFEERDIPQCEQDLKQLADFAAKALQPDTIKGEELEALDIKNTKLAIEVGIQRGLNFRYRKCLRLLGSIFFYGNFKTETHAERELWEEMKFLGYAFRSEDEILAYDTKNAEQGAISQPIKDEWPAEREKLVGKIRILERKNQKDKWQDDKILKKVVVAIEQADNCSVDNDYKNMARAAIKELYEAFK